MTCTTKHFIVFSFYLLCVPYFECACVYVCVYASQLTRDALLEAETGSVVLALFHKHEAIDNSRALLGRAQEMLTAAGPQPLTVMKTAMAYTTACGKRSCSSCALRLLKGCPALTR